MHDLIQPDRGDIALARLVPVHDDVGEEDDQVRQRVHAHAEGLGEHDEGRCVGEAMVEQHLVGVVVFSVIGEWRLPYRHPGALEGEVGNEVHRAPSQKGCDEGIWVHVFSRGLNGSVFTLAVVSWDAKSYCQIFRQYFDWA